MASDKSMEHAAATLAFDAFWTWLQAHPNCIIRAGTPEAVLYDDDELHWHFTMEATDALVVQLMRGKRLVGELLVAAADIAYVQAVAGEGDEDAFGLITQTETDRIPAYYFLLSHAYAPPDPPGAGLAVNWSRLLGGAVGGHRREHRTEVDRLPEPVLDAEHARRVGDPLVARVGDHRDRGQPGIRELLGAELPSVLHRQHEVEEDDRRPHTLAQAVDRLLAVVGADHAVALAIEDRRHRLVQFPGVLDQENRVDAAHRLDYASTREEQNHLPVGHRTGRGPRR